MAKHLPYTAAEARVALAPAAVPVSVIARAYGFTPNFTYRAVKKKEIEAFEVDGVIRCPTAPHRRRLLLDEPVAAASPSHAEQERAADAERVGMEAKAERKARTKPAPAHRTGPEQGIAA